MKGLFGKTKPSRTGALFWGATLGIIRTIRCRVPSRPERINAKDDDGTTPLMYAAWSNKNPEALTVLLETETEVNAREKHGLTPRTHATMFNKNPRLHLFVPTRKPKTMSLREVEAQEKSRTCRDGPGICSEKLERRLKRWLGEQPCPPQEAQHRGLR